MRKTLYSAQRYGTKGGRKEQIQFKKRTENQAGLSGNKGAQLIDLPVATLVTSKLKPWSSFLNLDSRQYGMRGKRLTTMKVDPVIFLCSKNQSHTLWSIFLNACSLHNPNCLLLHRTPFLSLFIAEWPTIIKTWKDEFERKPLLYFGSLRGNKRRNKTKLLWTQASRWGWFPCLRVPSLIHPTPQETPALPVGPLLDNDSASRGNRISSLLEVSLLELHHIQAFFFPFFDGGKMQDEEKALTDITRLLWIIKPFQLDH